LNGAVTLSDNRGSYDSTAEALGSTATDYNSFGYSGGAVSPVPEPDSTLLMGAGIAALAWVRKRASKKA
jgi:hypothetical protein